MPCNKLAVQPARLDVSIYEQLEASEQGRQAVSHLMASVLTVTVDVDDIEIVHGEHLGSITWKVEGGAWLRLYDDGRLKVYRVSQARKETLQTQFAKLLEELAGALAQEQVAQALKAEFDVQSDRWAGAGNSVRRLKVRV